MYIARKGHGQERLGLAESASCNGSATVHSHRAGQLGKAQSLM